VFQGARVIKNVTSAYDNVSTIHSNLQKPEWGIQETADTVESISGLLAHTKMTEIFDKYGVKTGKKISDIIGTGADWYAFAAE